MKFPVLFLAFALAAGPASAKPDEAAFAAFIRGDYEGAVARGVAAGDAEDLTLAARALNAVSYFDRNGKSVRARAKEAYDLAERAARIDPQLAEAHLQAAVALGFRGSKSSPIRAFLDGVPLKVRREVDAALEIDPDFARALSTSGAWRIEVARRGGGRLYGADAEVGYEEIEKAREIAPQNVAIANECALRLLADGRPEWRGTGLECLEAAVSGAPQSKFEADIQAVSRKMKDAVDAGPEAERAFIDAQH